MSPRQTARNIAATARRKGADAVKALTTRGPAGLRLSRRHLLQATGLGAVAMEASGKLSPGAHARPAAPLAPAAPLDGGDLQHFTGQFHSHTGVSCDHPTTRGEPIDAWKHVAEVSDLDFFAVTEHDVTYDVRNADIETEDWRDAVSQEWRLLHEQAEEFNKDVATTGLIAVPGTEHTWYDYSGHSNSFNTDFLVTAQSAGDHNAAGIWGIGNLMFDLPMFYARLAEDPGALAQFNHPNPEGGGNFFDFTHLTPEADARMNTIEVRGDDAFRTEYTLALDVGWHVAPVYGDDEHHDRWGENAPVTGIWATEQTEEALYEAFRNRSLYVSKDNNAQLLVRGNGEIMGSILDGDTTSLDLQIQAMDPDPEDSFATLIVRTNGGEEVHTEQDLGNEFDVTVTLEVSDGDYYWVELLQEDGDALFSAPIWIGERVAGSHYAPTVELVGRIPRSAENGQSVTLPGVRAIDRDGRRATVETTVYTSSGEVENDGRHFTVSGYDDHYIVVRASDATGSTAATYVRLQVGQDDLDPATVFRHFAPTVSVGASPGEVGIAVSTDLAITAAHLQYLPEGSEDWDGAPTVSTAADQVYEVVREGREGADYIARIGGQPLRSHDLDLTDLEPGTTYQYRLGVSESGPWTDVLGTVTAPVAGDAPLYVLGDLAIDSGDAGDYALFTGMLDVLRSQEDSGTVLLQTGDLIGSGGRAEWWDDISEHVFSTLDIPLAAAVGDCETGGLELPDGDKEFDEVSSARNAIFRGIYNLPKNGSRVGESNYSFDQGDVHVAVLNGRHDLKAQLEWLAEDMHATDATWRVVAGHYSYYGGAHAEDPGMAGDRAMVTDAFERLGIDLYLGGHDRLYKRTTIVDGQVAQTPEEVALGTTYVTVGSAGPNFDANQEFWWDDVVHDAEVQTGVVLDVTEDGLRLRAYDADGGSVDELTIGHSESDEVLLSSAEVIDGRLAVGVTSYPGSPEEVVVLAETTDASGQVLETRSATVALARTGGEQGVVFDEPLPVEHRHTAVVEVQASDGTVLVEEVTAQEAFTGSGTEADPYVIHSWDQMQLIAEAPDAHYLLGSDLELKGIPRPQIGAEWVVQEESSGTTRGPGAFTGVFDGGGHLIIGFRADGDIGGGRYSLGAGLFDTNAGTIRNLGVAEALMHGGVRIGGLLADTNAGTIERCWSSGEIDSNSRIGGLVGDGQGEIHDCYSTATVSTATTESGGVVGVGVADSVTERVYATGAVESGTNNSGGLMGYGYGGTVLRDSIALNPSVTAAQSAHAVLGRYSGGTPTLENNHAWEDMEVDGESYTVDPAPDNPKGGPATQDQIRSPEFYAETLGWDFDEVWEWNDDLDRPTLQSAPESG